MAPKKEDPRIGSLLNNRYRIMERIASGGMGVVYRGERLELGRQVAIKFLKESFKEDQKILGRFEREARAMSKLNHPYCVSVMDFGVESAPYIVMDFVTGKTLRDLLAAGRITVARAVRIADQVLAALAHAHGHGIVHRDIKPENILLCEAEGLGEHVRILDFGLAKLLDRTLDAGQSTSTVLMGTPSYMSPEQTQLDECDLRSDLYSTGVILFEMLAGRKPFFDENAINVLKMHRDNPPPLLAEADPGGRFSDKMEAVIRRALTKLPIERFQTAEEFAAALRATPEAIEGERDKKRSEDETEPFSYDEASPSEVSEELSTGSADVKRRRIILFRYGASALIVAVVAALLIFVSLRDRSRPDSSDPNSEQASRAKSDSEPGRATESAAAASPAPEPPQAALADAGARGEADGSAPDALGSEADEDPQEAPPEMLVFTLDEATANLPPPTVEEIRALIKEGRLDEAIGGLKLLRHRNPKNATYIFLLANVYFDKKWWSDAMDLYQLALRMSPKYKGNSTVNNNLITAFGSDKTYRKARKIIVKDIGKPSLPFLKSAAKRHKYQIVRERAAAVAKKVSRGWFGRLFV